MFYARYLLFNYFSLSVTMKIPDLIGMYILLYSDFFLYFFLWLVNEFGVPVFFYREQKRLF